MLIINAHGPNQNAEHFFEDLGRLVSQLSDTRYLIAAGDFNSHLTNNNLTADEAKLIGKFAGHDQFNENGQQMRMFLNLYTMAVRSTQHNSNNSFKWTWSNGVSRSQVDHLLTHLHSKLYLRKMCCVRPSAVSTDHKLLVCDIIESRSNTTTPKDLRNAAVRTSSLPRKNLNVALLKNTGVQKKFQDKIGSGRGSYFITGQLGGSLATVKGENTPISICYLSKSIAHSTRQSLQVGFRQG